MKRIMMLSILITFLTAVPATMTFAERYDDRPLIQLAILLDTSNSMDGLINQAKSQLWKIVSETGRTRYQGEEPILEVALYEYGNDRLSLLNGYIRKVVPFTTDLDYVSHNLFQLTTNGGSEYCGQAIQKANRQLDWSRNPRTLKLIFIAGNEPFSQGPVNYVHASNESTRKDIVVNSIFCGNYNEGVNTGWQHGALITGGSYMNINSDYSYSYIQAPQDDRIEELNRRLNQTYLGYGALGEEKKEMQVAQDSNASSLNKSSLLDRAKVKSSSSYSNAEWDLVDAYEQGSVDIEEIETEALPSQMQDMDEGEREEYVKLKLEERKAIQEEIAELSMQREAYIQEQMTEENTEGALDTAIIESLHNAAEKKGFELE